MTKKRFSVEQMVGVLKQAEVGVPVAQVVTTSYRVPHLRFAFSFREAVGTAIPSRSHPISQASREPSKYSAPCRAGCQRFPVLKCLCPKKRSTKSAYRSRGFTGIA